MPATTGRTGIGALLKLGDNLSPTAFATVANVVSIEAGGFNLELVDATHLGSPNYLREWLPSLRSAQAWNMTIQWDPTHATHDATTGLKAKQDGRLLTDLRVNLFQTGLARELRAQGYISELGNASMTIDGIMTQSFVFQPTGLVALATVASA